LIGLPLSYVVWFPLGFSNEQVHPFWEGFLLLFGLGAVTSILVSLATRPESIETLRGFYGRCRPPGFWGPVVREFPVAERTGIRAETARDLVDCALGILFATASIAAVVAPLGRHWTIFAGSLAILVASGGLFIARWSRRGVFRGLAAGHPQSSVERP